MLVDSSTFEIGLVSCSADGFVVAESSILRNNICDVKPDNPESAKRYRQNPHTKKVSLLYSPQG
jgi:hypothetical protein